jgi:hypothetical protein
MLINFGRVVGAWGWQYHTCNFRRHMGMPPPPLDLPKIKDKYIRTFLKLDFHT